MKGNISMNNKFYEGLLDYIKNNYLFLIVIFTILITFNINTGYSIYKPGGSINITERISSTETLAKSEGTINMAYVGVIEGKLPFYLLAKIIPSWDLEKNQNITYNDSETIKDSQKRDHLYYDESISNAKYLAYQKSGIDFTVKKETSYIIYKSEKSNADIKIGDELLSYDEIKYNSINELKSYIQSKEVGEEVNLLLKRNQKEIKTKGKIYLENDVKMLGVAASTIYDLDSTFNIKIDSKATESGPSGGLMLTLAIYNALVKEDITKGKKIVGTGTIALDGTVGEIGGIKYKLAGAVKDKADIFIVPTANYDEAIKYAKAKNYNILIKGVANFDEALNILKNQEG